MGLLDDLIGQLAGGPAQRKSTPPAQAGSGPDMSAVLIALAPVVLAMLKGNQRSGQGSAFGGGRGSDLGDVLGSLFGGGAGGLGGLLEQFQRAGFGAETQSWVGTGQNQPLPPGALERVFGKGGLSEIAAAAGLSEADASRGLSQLLPEMVDRVTPTGRVPDGESLLSNLSDLSRRLGGT